MPRRTTILTLALMLLAAAAITWGLHAPADVAAEGGPSAGTISKLENRVILPATALTNVITNGINTVTSLALVRSTSQITVNYQATGDYYSADLFVDPGVASGITGTLTVTLQSSADGAAWATTPKIAADGTVGSHVYTFTATSSPIARPVTLAGQFTRASISYYTPLTVTTTVATPTINLTLKNSGIIDVN